MTPSPSITDTTAFFVNFIQVDGSATTALHRNSATVDPIFQLRLTIVSIILMMMILSILSITLLLRGESSGGGITHHHFIPGTTIIISRSTALLAFAVARFHGVRLAAFVHGSRPSRGIVRGGITAAYGGLSVGTSGGDGRVGRVWTVRFRCCELIVIIILCALLIIVGCCGDGEILKLNRRGMLWIVVI